MRSVRVSSMVFHAHLTSLQDCPEAPREEKFEVSAKSSPISPNGNVSRSLVGSGVGSVSFRVATGSGFAPKNLLESVWEMSACKCTSPLSVRRGGTLFILLPCLHVATSHNFDLPMTSSAHFLLALQAAALSCEESLLRSSVAVAAHNDSTTPAHSLFRVHQGAL